MPEIKYFKKIRDAQLARAKRPPGPLDAFEFQTLATKSAIVRRLTRFALRTLLPIVTAILRFAWPNPRFGRFIFVTRHADCDQVLGDTASFPVNYRLEMREIAGGEDNILSLDGAAHETMRKLLTKHFRATDIDNVADWSREYAKALIEGGGGRIDVMRDLITRTSTEVSCRLMGLTAHDPDAFAEWTMAQSSLLFGDFFGDANIRNQAVIASAHLTSLIDDGIARVRNNNRLHPGSRRVRETLIDRLVTDGSLTDRQIRATILALITAFTPTNTLAAGNMLEVLLDDPRMYDEARRAAIYGDRDALCAVLLEAGRLNPALSPGIWRHAHEDGPGATIAAGTWRERRVRPGDVLLVCVPSALRDGRIPQELRDSPERRAWMMFGSGPHDCLGAQLALAHITGVFEVLLRQPRLAPAAGRNGSTMMRVGPYPTRFDMTWDAPRAQRAYVLASMPVRDGTPRADLERELEAIGNPVNPALHERLAATDMILFTSLSVIEQEPGSEQSLVLLELNADGTSEQAIGALSDAAFADYAPVLRHCTQDGLPPADSAALAGLFVAHQFDLHRWPWGPTGLHFEGLPELSVRDIRRQDELAMFARGEVHRFLKNDLSQGTRAMDVLLRTRRMIKQDSFYRLQRHLRDRLRAALPFQYDIVRPGRKRLEIAGWTPPEQLWSPVGPLARSSDGIAILMLLTLLWATTIFSLLWWLAPPSASSWLAWLWPMSMAVVGGAVLSALFVALLLGLFAWRLRWHEKRDWSDERIAELDHVKRVTAREDAPGYEQNHIIAVMPMKRGLLRRFTFALSMWWIKQAVTYWFRPGFVVSMGTIHKARWFRVPGTRQLVFFSNYDGSWESYLEDFVTRAHVGQTSAWTHGIGFPPTRYLIFDGAEQGDRFKRWVRRQQQVSAVWFSRFPHLTAKQIRGNALILDGLARAANDTDARRWLASFGSAQREPGELETQEAQSILFTGFGRQVFSTSLFISLPADPWQLSRWLRALSGAKVRTDIKFMPSSVGADEDPKGEPLPLTARIRFGDNPVELGGVTLGLSAAGLEKAGLMVGVGLDQFPAPFRMGMAGRGQILGDIRADTWRFADGPVGRPGAATDAVLTIYGQAEPGADPRAGHEELVALHLSFLERHGGALLHAVPCEPPGGITSDRLGFEHFGFRDGISQPFIRGTRRANVAIPERDIIAPGEFLLGYPNEQGFIAPPIGIGAEHDPMNILPVHSASDCNRYPRFGNDRTAPEIRDFGRNGSFLVIRQLDQDVANFHRQLDKAAKKLRNAYPNAAELVGREIDSEWLGAKIIGRWDDGSPLIGNATCPAQLSAEDRPDNDFAYGVDDPQGLACPLGAHIRRANPRDSQEPGDPDEQTITNRHRLLRRGRSYSYDPGGGKGMRNGLLFMALCSEIERQFEFIQHTWVNATSFHGLTGETDPLLGNSRAKDGTSSPLGSRPEGSKGQQSPSIFTVPTAVGPIEVPGLSSHVSLHGGGYFFLPSRSALRFLGHRLSSFP